MARPRRSARPVHGRRHPKGEFVRTAHSRRNGDAARHAPDATGNGGHARLRPSTRHGRGRHPPAAARSERLQQFVRTAPGWRNACAARRSPCPQRGRRHHPPAARPERPRRFVRTAHSRRNSDATLSQPGSRYGRGPHPPAAARAERPRRFVRTARSQRNRGATPAPCRPAPGHGRRRPPRADRPPRLRRLVRTRHPPPRPGALRPALPRALAPDPWRAGADAGGHRPRHRPLGSPGKIRPPRRPQDARLRPVPRNPTPKPAPASSPGSSRSTTSWKPRPASSSAASPPCAGPS